MEVENKKRLTVDIPIDMHQAIKITAAKYNITVTNLMLRWLIEQFEKEKKLDGKL